MNKIDFNLYDINPEYLKYLYSIDKEVYYIEGHKNTLKPYFGVIVILNSKNYFFIPLTPPKKKFSRWPKNSKSYIFVQDKSGSILGMLDIRKMIPVKQGLFVQTDLNKITDAKYKNLLLKKILFCKKNSHIIFYKCMNLYQQVKSRRKTFKFHCDYLELEQAMRQYNLKKDK
ncbi:type III toxin-antitoxin system ToxN/AbiQ family toxin [Mycoplasma sp. Ms02]|uniref:type III toxin-antitoxin system ToxN/AbiQ family toxin n=1 Tax=Mycoplasma sp. Ms02 TaxID=353851 RepID=UPI001C897C22|nr:type III toxin-antitoxin system ToxN/AbiQ family toxin [Mycoplasma sp. Ms02]QZE12539.1 type III toxin-antitoxin system ToxN/AbiQ family toxin [Mycoplasma sp. Ms02]